MPEGHDGWGIGADIGDYIKCYEIDIVNENGLVCPLITERMVVAVMG